MDVLTDIDLTWLASISGTCFYVAEGMTRGRVPVDTELPALLAEPVEALQQEIALAHLPPGPFWQHLVPLSARIESNRELAEAALARTRVAPERIALVAGPLAGRIADVEGAVLRAMPDLLDTLAQRSEPLRAQWHLRGQGLLGSVARLTDERLIPPGADVAVVPPAFGGGSAYLRYNAAFIEAGAEGAMSELPDVVYLAWLVAQLNVDVPIFSERIHPDRVPLVAAAAMLPPTLAAAEGLELARCDGPTIRAALAGGAIEWPQLADPSEVVLDWWQTYLASRPRFDVALAALDRMLG